MQHVRCYELSRPRGSRFVHAHANEVDDRELERFWREWFGRVFLVWSTKPIAERRLHGRALSAKLPAPITEDWNKNE